MANYKFSTSVERSSVVTWDSASFDHHRLRHLTNLPPLRYSYVAMAEKRNEDWCGH